LAEKVIAGKTAPADEDEVLEPLWIDLDGVQRLVREGGSMMPKRSLPAVRRGPGSINGCATA